MDETHRDQPRLAATSRDNDFTLSLDEVSQRYADAGHARTIRTLQRYCASGHLDAQKVATTTGDKYLVTSQSVARHIAQIEELAALDLVATDRDQSRLVVTSVGQELRHLEDLDKPRRAATDDRQVSPHVALLEREVERLNSDREFLRDQVKVKDVQIASLLERDRETNILVRGLQEMLTPLLGAPQRESPPAQPAA